LRLSERVSKQIAKLLVSFGSEDPDGYYSYEVEPAKIKKTIPEFKLPPIKLDYFVEDRT